MRKLQYFLNLSDFIKWFSVSDLLTDVAASETEIASTQIWVIF